MSNDFSEFLKLIQPKLSFEESIHPSEPDYSDKYNWAAIPDIEGQQFYVPDSEYEIKKNKNKHRLNYFPPFPTIEPH